MIKKEYDLMVANSLAKLYKNLTNINYKTRKRTLRDAYLRSLFYKVLRDLNDMNDRMISDYCKNVLGKSRDRSSICISLSKVDLYYLNYKEYRDAYDFFFDDKVKEQRRREIKNRRAVVDRRREKQRVKEIQLAKMVSFKDSKRIELNNMIAEIPDDKILEIVELLTLRVKSWSWKAKNEYEIIESSY